MTQQAGPQGWGSWPSDDTSKYHLPILEMVNNNTFLLISGSTMDLSGNGIYEIAILDIIVPDLSRFIQIYPDLSRYHLSASEFLSLK